MTDWQLLGAYAQGDEQAFETLFRRFFPIVYSAALRRLNDSHLAEDVAQSVFIIFARKAPKLSRNVVLSGWFLRTTTFVARDALKQMSRRLQREQEASTLSDIEQKPGWEPGWTEAVPLVDEALFALSTGEQVCVIARYLENRSFREIAELQRISEDGAQKRVSRGLEKMRSFLQRRGVKVSAIAIPAILTADLASAAGQTLVQTALTSIHSVLSTSGSGSQGLALADQFLRRAMWRRFMFAGGSTLLVLALLTGGTLLFRSGLSRSPSFQVSDLRVEALGRAWAQVVRQAAFLITNFRQAPAQNDPRAAEYRQITAFVVGESSRISSEVNALLKQQPSDRILMAEFLTVELNETLGLRPRQRAEVFGLLRERLSAGANLKEALNSLYATKSTSAAAIRKGLSSEQIIRFNQTYGADDRGLFTFAALAAANS